MRIFTIFVFLMFQSVGIIQAQVTESNNWYAGTWDSNVYEHSYHPSMVAFRIEVVDEETRVPISGAVIHLEGKWEERINPHIEWDRKTRTMDFKLIAFTDDRGIAVFALRWQKWIEGDMDFLSVDDVEKVQVISVRSEGNNIYRNGYQYQEIPIDFSEIVKYRNDLGWRDLILASPGSKYFVLKLGEDFDKFGQKSCADPIFFERIRDENYGTLLQGKHRLDFNYFYEISNPLQEAGPFIMIPIEFKMKRIIIK